MKPRSAGHLHGRGLMKKAALVIFYLLSVVVAAEVSARLAMKNTLGALESELSRMQGELSLRHLQRYSELESNLAKGCHAAVLEKLRISVAIESTLLSRKLSEHPNGELSKYVTQHAPGLPEKLAGYKSPYGNSWKEPACD